MPPTNPEPRVGRPPVVPGEASIEIRPSIEIPLYRHLRRLAQLRRESVHDVIRALLRDGVSREKVDTMPPRP